MRLMLLIIASLLLLGCNQAPGYKDVDYYVGSDGLVLSMAGEANLETVYEDSLFSVNYAVDNKGAYDVIGEEQAIFTMSFDPFYIDASKLPTNDYLKVSDGSVTMKGIKLPGKSRYYPTGSNLFLYFPGLRTKTITGQRAQPETQLFASLCYPYQTTLSRLVCVDFSVFDNNLRSQVCKQQDLSPGDQGAPVAVHQVEVDNQPASNNLVRPVFTIHVSNVGRGSVLSPVTSSEDLERVCSSKDLERQDFNTVKVEALLSESTQLICTPDVVRLNNGDGVTRCTVSDEELERTISYRQNYQAPLTVKLSYVYLSTFSKDLEIKRVNLFPGSVEETEQCLAHEIKQGGECISRCEYCATHLTAGECQPSGMNDIDFNAAFSCACGLKECNDNLYAKGLCVPAANFCPAASYCCARPCKTGETMGADGKCYKQCSSCSEVEADCMCGEQIVKTGFCCAKTSSAFATEDQCDQACG